VGRGREEKEREVVFEDGHPTERGWYVITIR